MFAIDVKYIALTVGVLGVAMWGVVGSGWHFARAAGSPSLVHQRDDVYARANRPAPAASPVAPQAVPPVSEASPVAAIQGHEVSAALAEVEPATFAETVPEQVSAAAAEAMAAIAEPAASSEVAALEPEATPAVTVLDDVFYDANRDALVVPYSGAAPQASRVFRMGDGLAFVDFTNARTAFGRPRFKRQPDAAFKSYILNTRPGVDRARLSFVVARPGQLQVEAGSGELVVRLTRP